MQRREFLQAASLLALTGLGPAASASPPAIPDSVVACGDVHADRAILWSRCDRPARMLVEWSGQADFAQARRVAGPRGLTAQVGLRGLPANRRIYYRIRFQDERGSSPWAWGSFKTPGPQVRFAWGADVVGQGWGIDENRGGMLSFQSMAALKPDFFLHVGDSIYADGPLPERRQLEDGSWWVNRVTPAKSRAATTLEDFRGNYEYNLLDPHYREFFRSVPVVAIWSDHELHDNWWPGSPGPSENVARQAFQEYWPVPSRLYRSLPYGPHLELFVLDLRSYRGPNAGTAGGGEKLLGRTQLDWLKQALLASSATWKVIATEIPIAGSYTPQWGLDGWANGAGPPQGRERELAELLSFLRQHQLANVVWLSGDVHYAAAVHYHPERAATQDFLPFWEFIAGPLHAGTFGPTAELDPTFGPRMEFCAVPPDLKPNRPPSEGLQFFGLVEVGSGSPPGLRVSLYDRQGRQLHSQDLAAR